MAEGGSDALVLVTGASGFIATHIVKQLQEEGYKVRGTVRSLENEDKIKHLKKLCPEATHPLELVEADLTKADAWENAVKDCTYVIHVASPFPAQAPKDENEVIQPAVDGTVNLLKACQAAKCVKRVVLTSSVAAIAGSFTSDSNKVFTEEDWTDLSKVDPYAKSKTLAEKAAWDFVKDLPENEKFELAVINPCYVMGPVLNNSSFTSMEVPKRLLERAMPAIPRLNFPIVDVRDVAKAHVRAMVKPEAAGQRFVAFHKNMWLREMAQVVSKEFKSQGNRHILCNVNLWLKEMAEIMAPEFDPQGYNVPTTPCPYFAVWIYGLFDKTVKLVLPNIGKQAKFDNTRMKDVLGIEPIDPKDTILEMCYTMIENGQVKKTKKYRGPKKDTEIEQAQEKPAEETGKPNGDLVEDKKEETGSNEEQGKEEEKPDQGSEVKDEVKVETVAQVENQETTESPESAQAAQEQTKEAKEEVKEQTAEVTEQSQQVAEQTSEETQSSEDSKEVDSEKKDESTEKSEK